MKGYKPSQLWLTPEVHELLKKAAAVVHRPLANFIKDATLRAAAELKRNTGPEEWAAAKAAAAESGRHRRRRS